jgi:hypothetical protein
LTSSDHVAVSYRLLLGIYLIVPLCLIVQIVDNFLLGNVIQQSLPSSPRHYFIYQILFGTPHIIASTIIIISNKEYFNLYRNRLLVVTILIIAFFAIGKRVFSYNILFIIVATFTIIHVIRQQFGIGNSVGKLSGLTYFLWSWSGIILGIILYNAIFLRRKLDHQHINYMKTCLMFLSIFLCILAMKCHSKIRSQLGKVFLWSNTIMIITVFYFYLGQYYFFAMLVPRIVHDITAFVFYITHDYNRHVSNNQRNIYKIFNIRKFGYYMLLPLAAVMITFILEKYGDYYFNIVSESLFDVHVRRPISLAFIGYLGLMHYYTEAFTWKRGSPYRNYIFLQP